jgi:hypothetical protein
MSQPLDGGKPCSYLQDPKNDELFRYALEGNSLLYSADTHIAKCNSCRQQLESLISTNSSLLRKLYRCQCPDINILARYAANLASLSEGLLVISHIHNCPLCTQDLQEMQKILEDDLI